MPRRSPLNLARVRPTNCQNAAPDRASVASLDTAIPRNYCVYYCVRQRPATQSIPAVHGGCQLRQRTRPTQWQESASLWSWNSKKTSPMQHICIFSRKQLCVAFKTCGACRAGALKYLFRTSVLLLATCRAFFFVPNWSVSASPEPPNARPRLAARGVMRGTGPVIEAEEPAEFVLTPPSATRTLPHLNAARANVGQP